MYQPKHAVSHNSTISRPTKCKLTTASSSTMCPRLEACNSSNYSNSKCRCSSNNSNNNSSRQCWPNSNTSNNNIRQTKWRAAILTTTWWWTMARDPKAMQSNKTWVQQVPQEKANGASNSRRKTTWTWWCKTNLINCPTIAAMPSTWTLRPPNWWALVVLVSLYFPI